MANRHYHFKFNVEKDATYIQRLDAQENMQNYIRRLILSDIAADGLKDLIQLAPENEKPDPDPEAIEFQRRADLMARYCHGIGDNSDPDYCYSCPWSYYPRGGAMTIRCKFDGLTSHEMDQIITETHNRIIKHANTERSHYCPDCGANMGGERRTDGTD